MRLSTSDQIRNNMESQGRTYTWLMREIGVSRRTFYKKLNDNIWTFCDLMKLKDLGIL